MRPRKRGNKWVYPKSADVLRAARLQPLHHYIQKRRATVAKTIDGRPVLEECRGAGRLRGTPVRQTWWEQELSPPPEPEKEARGGSPWHGGAGGGGGSRSKRWDGDAARRRRQWEDLVAERREGRVGILDGVIQSERERVQTARGAPSTPHQEFSTAVPLHHRAAPTAAAQPAAAFLPLLQAFAANPAGPGAASCPTSRPASQPCRHST